MWHRGPYRPHRRWKQGSPRPLIQLDPWCSREPTVFSPDPSTLIEGTSDAYAGPAYAGPASAGLGPVSPGRVVLRAPHTHTHTQPRRRAPCRPLDGCTCPGFRLPLPWLQHGAQHRLQQRATLLWILQQSLRNTILFPSQIKQSASLNWIVLLNLQTDRHASRLETT